MTMASIAKWGNSRALRIPKDLTLATGLDLDTKVKLKAVKGRLHVTPLDEPHFTLEELEAGITPENRHEEWDTGPPVCKEIW